ncbi:polyadenylate-binding protein 2 isoform X2 [Microcaecilia unicolor]|uniref:Polyadenylate-binding protein 2 isoform X2 n=1 Tax=Microcaecilia unicolor TaxID=1415580 RepID=A0A6P7WRA1_9AMPH|nr:polyadenylate-binding protein 2 isoform X2 [Microcaecilia unicolor]
MAASAVEYENSVCGAAEEGAATLLQQQQQQRGRRREEEDEEEEEGSGDGGGRGGGGNGGGRGPRGRRLGGRGAVGGRGAAALEELEDEDIEEEEPGEIGDPAIEDPELEAIKARVREMEEEAEKLKELQNEVEKQMNMSPPPGNAGPVIMSLEEKMEADARSIYVGNVDYGATAEELEAHFHGCGSVNRVTILCDKFSGHPKGFAYIEFSDKESVRTSMALDDSLFRGRQIKVVPKRTNRPGISSTDRGFPRARYRARSSSYSSRSRFYSGYSARPRGRVYRGRARATSWYSPY